MLRQQGDWLTALMMKAAASSEPDITFREMYFLEYSRKIRAAVELPLAYLGGIKSLANAEQAVAEGFDCVVLARALLHDPALVNKFRSGELSAVRLRQLQRLRGVYLPSGGHAVRQESAQ